MSDSILDSDKAGFLVVLSQLRVGAGLSHGLRCQGGGQRVTKRVECSQPFQQESSAFSHGGLRARIVIQILRLIGIVFQVVEFAHVASVEGPGIVNESPRSPAQCFTPDVLGDCYFSNGFVVPFQQRREIPAVDRVHGR